MPRANCWHMSVASFLVEKLLFVGTTCHAHLWAVGCGLQVANDARPPDQPATVLLFSGEYKRETVCLPRPGQAAGCNNSWASRARAASAAATEIGSAWAVAVGLRAGKKFEWIQYPISLPCIHTLIRRRVSIQRKSTACDLSFVHPALPLVPCANARLQSSRLASDTIAIGSVRPPRGTI